MISYTGYLPQAGANNLGLQDQKAALKWVKNNIRDYGGNPDDVTLAGASAGASALILHLLAEDSQGRTSNQTCEYK